MLKRRIHAYATFVCLLFATNLRAAEENLEKHAISVRDGNLYLYPDKNSDRLDTVGRGREVVILESTRGWLHVMANVDQERSVTGWTLDKGIIRTTTPNGDQILFGEAVDSEAEATRRHGRKGADRDAQRLYYRLQEYFPQSPYAAEAMFRSADIRWQLEREDAMSRPSARERDPNMRHQMEEDYLKQVMKKYPGTRWADLAAYDLLDNKVCGDWQGEPKCPEKEAQLYEKYATEHPQSPKVAEALYNAAWRQAVLVDMYKQREDSKKSAEAQSKAAQLAQRIAAQFPQSDFGPRAQRLLYMLQQNIPTYGPGTD
jgi:outer membrane protein assembly factor BamD (BamD/ComL family)